MNVKRKLKKNKNWFSGLKSFGVEKKNKKQNAAKSIELFNKF